MRITNQVRTLALLALAGCVAEVGEETEELDLESKESAVQSDWRQFQHYNVATTPGDDLAVTGAVIVPLRDAAQNVRTNPAGAPIRATCGVTFISPRYAITAAHCVDGPSLPNPATDMLTVEQYDMSALPMSKVWSSATVTGGFPNYTRPTLSEADGYKVTRYNQCKLVRRCASQWGPQIGCDAPADVALLHCADRSRFASYINVADVETPNGPVEMPWFHEVVDMVMDDPGPAPQLQPPEDPTYFTRLFAWMAKKDRYDHYTVYKGETTADQNYHYVAQQLLPLRSAIWRTGDLFAARRRVGDHAPNLVKDGDFEAQPARSLSWPWVGEGSGQGVDIELNYEYQGRKNGFIWARNGWNAMTQDVQVVADTEYVLTAWVRNSQNFGGGYFGVRNAATNAVYSEVNFGALGRYTQLRVRFNSGKLGKVRVFAGYWGPASSDAWLQVDEVRLHQRDIFDEELTNSTYTDLFGCHGTSGSGVLQRNASGKLELLGPVSRGSIEMAERLCHDGSKLRQGGRYLAYTRPEYVRELVRTAYEDANEWKIPIWEKRPIIIPGL